MKVFLSWSGERSKALAEALRDWLPLVINAVEPWMSSEDISAGARWSEEVARSLDESRVGVFCLTPENLDSPWINFEAGAVAKDRSNSYVCTLLLRFPPSQVPLPLSLFQAKQTSEKDVLDLVLTINGANEKPILREQILRRSFEKWWPDLLAKINAIPNHERHQVKKRPDAEILEEILLLLRQQRRDLEDASLPIQKRISVFAKPGLESLIRSLSPAFRSFRIEKMTQKGDVIEIWVKNREVGVFHLLRIKWHDFSNDHLLREAVRNALSTSIGLAEIEKEPPEKGSLLS